MVEGDVIKFSVGGTYAGQTWITTWFYRVVAMSFGFEPSMFDDIANEFAEGPVAAFWAASVAHIRGGTLLTFVNAENLFNVSEVVDYLLPTPYNGGAATEGLGPQDAYGFSTPRKRRGMNAGQRRFPGVAEGSIGDAGVLTSGAVTALQNAANVMSGDVELVLDGGVDVTLEPVIVQRIRSGAGTPEDPYTYALPTSQAQMGDGYYVADGWTIRPYTTTQNSRKRGRGI